MNPNKVERAHVIRLTDLPNIGEAGAKDLRLLGIDEPQQLVGKSPFEMYHDLCLKTGTRHDPCVIDVFMSVTSFMAGEPAGPWWHFTQARKEWQRQGAGQPSS
jgi:hypothetical protein